MTIAEKLHMLHRIWRYRLRTEQSSLSYLMQQDLEGTTVLDIGANYGIYTYWMSKKVGRQGTVIAFEPQPELEDSLLDLKDTFHLTNAIIHTEGLSDHAHHFNLVRGSVGSGGARLEQESDKTPEGANLERVSISLTTLDDYVSKHTLDNLSFIKCDVEGHELAALKGGEAVLKEYMPTLLFECHDPEAKKGELFAYLTGLGYTGFFLQRGKKIHYSHFAKYPYSKVTNNYRNYIFATKERAGTLSE